MSSWRLRSLLLALAVCTLNGATQAQAPTATLTITNNGPNSGAVGVQPGGNVCNPNPGGAGGGAPCPFTYPVGTPLRIMANSPSAPGIFNSGTGDAENCATSVCEFILNGDSSITATFDAGGGPFAALTIHLLGDLLDGGKGNVGTDNNQCQNFELGFSACTTYYGAGSSVVLKGRAMPGNIFAGFSGGTADAGGCSGTGDCNFTLLNDSSVDATFSAMSSVAITPSSATINVGNNAFFNARATFANGMTRFGFTGNTPWQSHVPMDAARFSLAAEVVNDRLYAIGGVNGFCPSAPCGFGPRSTVEVFDPLVTLIAQFFQAWTPRASMTTPRESLASAVVDGKIYAIGGHTSGGDAVESMESYDPVSNTWSTQEPMSGPRARMAAAVINNTIYVVGGITSAGGNEQPAVATVEAYDALNNGWITTPAPPAAMLIARNLPAAAAVNGILYVIGGDGTGSVEAYDPAEDEWTMKAPMPSGGGSHRAVALNGLIYAVGGSPVNVKVYNPALDSWAALSSTSQQPSGEFALAVLDGRMFAAGGNLADNTPVSAVLANRPPETTWWSHNSAVGRINAGNSGSVNGVSAGTATISARLVGLDSGGNVASGGTSATLTVNPGGGGGGSGIFLGIPTDPTGGGPATFTEVGQANWGCGTFAQSADGPWEVKIKYFTGGPEEVTPYAPPPGPCGGGPNTKGVFFFNHAYGSPGTYEVTVTVRNTTTNESTTRAFHIEVEEAEPEDCVPIISNITVIGTVPFDRVHVAVFDRVTGALLTDPDTALPFGFFDDAALPAGQYRFEFSVPAGYMVTPSSVNVDAVCGQPINLNLTVQAIPATPPTISLEPSPGVLWPPNNKMRAVSVTIDASSPDGHPAVVRLMSITSSEPGTDDIQGAAYGTDDRTFELRAKRLGNGPGRTYTVTYQVTDTVTGLTTTASTTVVVPHDQGKK